MPGRLPGLLALALAATLTPAAASGGIRGRITEVPLVLRVSRGGRLRVLRLPKGAIPYGIAAGPDGNVWFAQEGRPAIGRIAPDGRITEFSRGLRPGSQPFEITAAADGAMWFTDQGRRPAIGRIRRDGQITELSVGLAAGSSPFGIAAAAGRAMWFTVEGPSPAMGRVGPDGSFTEYSHGLQRGSEPALLASATDGRLWFTDESSTTAVGELGTGAPPAVRRAASVTGRSGPGRRRSCRLPRWARWAGRAPSLRRFAFDGIHWLRDGRALPGERARTYRVEQAGARGRLACRVTATYPWPLLVTVSSTSATVPVR